MPACLAPLRRTIVRRYTDENGWYHRHVTEVITFNYDPSAEDGADEETKVIDASKDAATDLVSDSTPSVLPLNVEKRAFR